MNTDFSVMHFDTAPGWRGGQNQVFLLMRELKKYNISQLLLSPPGSPLGEKSKELGIDFVALNVKNDLDIPAGLKLRKKVKDFMPDIIHFHTSRALGVGSWALKNIKTGKICTRRVDLPVSGSIINRMKYKSADIIVAISQFICDYMKNSGYINTELVYSSVDIDSYYHKRCYGRENGINVAMAGAFDLRHKDFETFIKSAAFIGKNTECNNIKFIIAGSGPDRKKIESIIRSENAEDIVSIRGFVEDMSLFLKQVDILVHNVNFEGLGTVILQGMASGLPVVASDAGGIPEIIQNGNNGFLVPVKDYRESADRIVALAADKKLRENMGTAGRQTVLSRFSPKVMARRYMDIYRRVLEK